MVLEGGIHNCNQYVYNNVLEFRLRLPLTFFRASGYFVCHNHIDVHVVVSKFPFKTYAYGLIDLFNLI